jgi:hypothetical protein
MTHASLGSLVIFCRLVVASSDQETTKLSTLPTDIAREIIGNETPFWKTHVSNNNVWSIQVAPLDWTTMF